MRYIGTVNSDREATTLSRFLASEGIAHQFEPERVTNWENPDYGLIHYKLWIIEEDQLDAAMDWYAKFVQNPDDPEFHLKEELIPPLKIPPRERIREIPSKIVDMGKRSARTRKPIMGPITYYLLLLCLIIFTVDGFYQPQKWPIPTTLPLTPLYASSIKRTLMIDYPVPYELFNKLVDKYGVETVQNPQELPPEAQSRLVQIVNLPYWKGLYDATVAYFHNASTPISESRLLFQKVREGEIWRLFTPCLLHGDIFHILFNMLWLFALGKQLEEKLKAGRYIIFILITGIISNIVQYLMTGSNFLGFSGVLCAMIMFVHTRQRLAAWEGYRLDRMTFAFLMVFIFGMLGFQIASFFVDISTGLNISPAIANTAHVTGLVSGYVLARMPFFAWK